MLEEEEEEDNSFIKMVSRNHEIFTGRHATLYSVVNGVVIKDALPTIPEGIIVCDGCNKLIKDEEVGLLMLDENRCWGTQCKTCIKEFFSEIPLIPLEE